MAEVSAFVEEIDYHEVNFIQVVGRGAFGVVSQAKWRGIDVAVKHIETENEKKAFITELKQLSRVSHPNIVRLYGASTTTPVCLVMEYAEGGSLYNMLHGLDPQPDYTFGHAMSWSLQCACGVEYLHGMKPRPLIHRDLKPPNLLLISGGTILKICDFGTACDAHTHMTNNKGSAAWMAPEVFEGSKYSEKCDVFSWGIILWEVLTRRKPFDEIGGPAFRIMWAVHNGTRPPLVANCPKPIERLMTRCWASNPVERPSMGEVVRIMKLFLPYISGGDQPLVYPIIDAEVSGVSLGDGISIFDPPLTNPSPSTGGSSTMNALRDTVRMAFHDRSNMGEPVPVVQPVTPKVKPVVVEDEILNWRRTSAPASLAASRESLLDKSSRSSTPSIDLYKRYSADLSKLEEVDFLAQGAAMGASQKPPGQRGHRRTGSHGNSASFKPSDFADIPAIMTHSLTAPTNLTANTQAASNYRNNSSVSWSPGAAGVTSPLQLSENSQMTQAMMLNNMVMANIPMDYQHQPLPPCKSNPESMAIFEEHKRVAAEYRRVQVEIMVLSKRHEELKKELAEDEQEQISNNRLVEEFSQLAGENNNLLLLKKNVQKTIDQWKNEQQKVFDNLPSGRV